METKTQWRPGPTVCRCCLAEGCYKDISTEYFWMGKREVYSEMLSDTLDIVIAYSQSSGPNSNSRLICEPCISRLRDASEFKKQVLECEKTFMQHLDPGRQTPTVEVDIVPVDSSVKVETVKVEKRLSDEDFDDRIDFGGIDDDDDLDDEPLTKLASKIPKTEKVDLLDLLDNAKVTGKRKSSSKSKTTSVKKSKTKSKDLSQPSASTTKAEKKKKGGVMKMPYHSTTAQVRWRKKQVFNDQRANANIIIGCSNVVPFRWSSGKFTCSYCKIVFTDVSDIRPHTKQHPNRLEIFDNLKTSVDCIKIEISDLKCSICSQTMISLDCLKSHLVSDHNMFLDKEKGDGVIPYLLRNDKLKCVECGEKFHSFFNLNKHMNGHYQRYVCDDCGKTFAAIHRRKAHIRSHEVGEFPCSKCDVICRSTTARYNHLAVIHGHKDRYACPHCSEKFVTHARRNRHLIDFHGKTIEYPCSLCPAMFHVYKARTRHIQKVHVRRSNRGCTVPMSSPQFSSPLECEVVLHVGERKYECEICQKMYARQATLKEHSKSHTDGHHKQDLKKS